MTKKIRIGIAGYGNLGKGTEAAIMQNEDMELVAVVTRRDPSALDLQTKSAIRVHMSDIESLKESIDVMMICGGSATDLPEMSPKLAGMFNIIDSFDTHKNIPAETPLHKSHCRYTTGHTSRVHGRASEAPGQSPAETAAQRPAPSLPCSAPYRHCSTQAVH